MTTEKHYHTRTQTPDEIALRATIKIPPLLLPQASSVFAERALRLRERAAGHAMRDYLMLLAVICEAQHERLQQYAEVPLPTDAQIESARNLKQPLLDSTSWERDPAWRGELRAMLRMAQQKIPADSPAHAGLRSVLELPDAALEQQADRLLGGITLGLDMAAAPLIAAGLQLYWTHLAAATVVKHPGAYEVPDEGNRCPCCGSLPTASVTRIKGKMDGQRYLHCSLCSAQWHYMRVKCANCLSLEGIQYRSLQPVEQEELAEERAAIEAETCDRCHHYLKILHMGQDPSVEVIADDLATLTLDLLATEAGYARYGNNLLLLFGDSETTLN